MFKVIGKTTISHHNRNQLKIYSYFFAFVFIKKSQTGQQKQSIPMRSCQTEKPNMQRKSSTNQSTWKMRENICWKHLWIIYVTKSWCLEYSIVP